MSAEEIINLLKYRKKCCELALKDLYNIPSSDIDIIQVEVEFYVYESLLKEIE